MADAQIDPNLQGQVLFYQNPEPLDPTRHGRLGMRRSDAPFGFAAKQHFVPLHVSEFGPASVNYPIIFAGDEHAPLAVLGITPGENLYIDARGAFRTGVYIPSFIRRYPFVAAKDDQAQRMVVCIDRSASLWVEDEADVKLFENGEPTEFTKNCIQFCSQFDADRRQTESFLALMTENDLFDTRKVNYTPRDENGNEQPSMQVAEFFGVSDEKLKALSPAKLAELRDSGALGQIYAHVISQFNWDRMIVESITRNNAAAQTVGNA
jgi:hypothetical protein